MKRLGSKITASLFAGGLLSAVPLAPVMALGDNDYLGTIGLVAFNFCPRGTFPAEGQMVLIVNNEALYSLLGTTYGGDGRTTFALPDLRGKEPLAGTRYCIVIQGIYPSRT